MQDFELLDDRRFPALRRAQQQNFDRCPVMIVAPDSVFAALSAVGDSAVEEVLFRVRLGEANTCSGLPAYVGDVAFRIYLLFRGTLSFNRVYVNYENLPEYCGCNKHFP